MTTKPLHAGHCSSVAPQVSRTHEPPPVAVREESRGWTFEAVYDAHFAFVWRTVRRLGVIDSAVDDVVQDVFLVVHRQLDGFRGESPMRSWLFAIASRVARDTRRSLRRKPANLGGRGRVADTDLVVDGGPTPHETVAALEAVHRLHAILDTMMEERREVFVLAELEEMTVRDIAAAVHANPNTVYSRLRAARADFERALTRARANNRWRIR